MTLVPHGPALRLRAGYRSTPDVWTHAQRLDQVAQRDLPHLLDAPPTKPGDVTVRFYRLPADRHGLPKTVGIDEILLHLVRTASRLPTDHEVALLLEDGRRHRAIAPPPQSGMVKRPFALLLSRSKDLLRCLLPVTDAGQEWTYREITGDAVRDRVERYAMLIPCVSLVPSRVPWLHMRCRERLRLHPRAKPRPTQLPLPFSPP